MAYRVAPDDVFYSIQDRFSLPARNYYPLSLFSLNCYRRKDAYVYVGDILNLSPYTVKSVGSENGSTEPRDQEFGRDCLEQTGMPPQDSEAVQ